MEIEFPDESGIRHTRQPQTALATTGVRRRVPDRMKLFRVLEPDFRGRGNFVQAVMCRSHIGCRGAYLLACKNSNR